MHTGLLHFMATLCAVIFLASCASPRLESNNNDIMEMAVSPPAIASPPTSASEPFTQSQLLNLLTAELASQYGDNSTALHSYQSEGAALNSPELLMAAQLAAERSLDIEAMERNVKQWLQLLPNDLNARKASLRTAAAKGDGARLLRESVALFQHTDDLDILFGAATYLQHDNKLQSGFASELTALLLRLSNRPLDQQLALELLDCQVAARTARSVKQRQRLVDCATQISAGSRHHGGSDNSNKIWRISVQLTVQLLTQLRRHFEAIALLKQTLRERADAHLAFDLARLLLNLDRRGAQATLDRVLQIDPNHHQARLLQAVLHIDNNRIELAQPLLQIIPNGSRWHSDAQYQLARIADHYQQPKRALQHFRQVQPGVHFERSMQRTGELLWSLYGQQTVRQWLHLAPRQYPLLSEQFYLLELQLAFENSDSSAHLEVIDRALTALPNSLPLLSRGAQLLEQQSQFSAAAKQWRRVLAQEPDNTIALSALGNLQLSHLGHPREGHALLRRANTIEPGNPEILNHLGWALFRLGDLEGALGRLLRAYSIEESAQVASQLGEVYWQLKKPHKAINLWREALQRFPETHYVRDTVDRLHVDLNGVYE